MNKVFSIVRQTCGRNPTDDLKDLDVNTAIWDIFLSVTLQAAVHLGQDYTDNLPSTKNQPLKSVTQLFETTVRLIKDQTEITGLTTIDWMQPVRRATTLLCNRAVQIANSQTHVFPTQCSVWETSVTNQSRPGKDRVKWLLETRYLKDLDWIDGEPMEFEWKNFPAFTTLRILDEIQKMMTESRFEPEQLNGRILFMSMYSDIVQGERRNKENIVLRILSKLQSMLEDSRKNVGRFRGPGCEKKWYGTHTHKPDGVRDKNCCRHDAQLC